VSSNNFKTYFKKLKINYGVRLLILLSGGIILLFVIAPVAGMFISAEGITDTIKDKEVIDSIRLTLCTSFVATLIFGILSVPLAYFLARRNFYLKPLVLAVIDLPIVIPHSAAGIALLGFINRDSLVGKAASYAGIDFVSNPAGVIVAMAFVSLPFFINSARDGFANVPVRFEKVAASMGAGPLKIFFTISLPLAYRSILSGAVMMFARGMSEFGAVVIIAYHPMIAPVMIWDRFTAYGMKYAQPVAVVFLFVTLIVFTVLRYISKKPK